jgi:hypothetical protein
MVNCRGHVMSMRNDRIIKDDMLIMADEVVVTYLLE